MTAYYLKGGERLQNTGRRNRFLRGGIVGLILSTGGLFALTGCGPLISAVSAQRGYAPGVLFGEGVTEMQAAEMSNPNYNSGAGSVSGEKYGAEKEKLRVNQPQKIEHFEFSIARGPCTEDRNKNGIIDLGDYDLGDDFYITESVTPVAIMTNLQGQSLYFRFSDGDGKFIGETKPNYISRDYFISSFSMPPNSFAIEGNYILELRLIGREEALVRAPFRIKKR